MLELLAWFRGALGLQNDALQFFKDWEMLIGVVNFSVALALGNQKTNLFHPFQLALDITGVFLDKLGQTSYMRLKIGVLGIDHDNFSAHP